MIFDYVSLKHKTLDAFKQSLFVHGAMLPDGNEDVNRYTAERFIAVWAMMDKLKLRDVIHVENDNMIYGTIAEIVSAIQLCAVHLAVPFPCNRSAVVGHIQKATALPPFIEFSIRVFGLNKEKAIRRFEEWVGG